MTQGFINDANIPVPLPVSMGGTGVITSTGSGSTVLSTSPTLATPILGIATATSLTFSPTTNGIVGTTTNNNAGAGVVGEVITNTATGVALSGNIAANITSIILTAGDWDIYGSIEYQPAGTTTTSYTFTSISETSASITGPRTVAGSRIAGTVSAYPAPSLRVLKSSSTTYYLVGLAQFAVSTMTAGGTIYARRRR